MGVPAAVLLDRQVELPRAFAEHELAHRVEVAAPAFEAGETEFRILLPVPIRGKLGQRAKTRLALAQHALGLPALQKLSDLIADDAQRAQQAFVRLARDAGEA